MAMASDNERQRATTRRKGTNERKLSLLSHSRERVVVPLPAAQPMKMPAEDADSWRSISIAIYLSVCLCDTSLAPPVELGWNSAARELEPPIGCWLENRHHIIELNDDEDEEEPARATEWVRRCESVVVVCCPRSLHHDGCGCCCSPQRSAGASRGPHRQATQPHVSSERER